MTNTANPKANIPSRWFALSVQPGLEKTTAQALQKRVPGVDEAVVPSETLKKNNRLGQKITVDKLIFPGYAFVKAQLQDAGGAMNTVVYDRVLAVYGVRDFVGSVRSTTEGQVTMVAPMTEQEITDIKEYMARNKEEGGRIENAFKDGEAIRVTGSSFMGLEGRVIRVDNEQGKANVVLQVFGRETSVELNTADIERATS
jgi:transcriptional antiterminator NusG